MRVRSLTLVLGIALFPLTAAAQTGTVTGTVTSASGAALPGIDVEITRVDGSGGFAAVSGPDGFYTINVTPGTYVAFTSTGAGQVNEIYDNVQCPGFCTLETAIAAGARFTVAAGATVPGRDFSLEAGGAIRGRVTDEASVGLAGIVVFIRDANDRLVTSRTTNGTGDYVTQVGLKSGAYYASTSNSAGYFNEIYDNIDCGVGCPTTVAAVGTPIPVTAGATTPNIDFALQKGANISGTVTAAGTGSGVGATVFIYNATGAFITAANTALPGGSYVTPALRAGTYFAFTSNTEGFIDQLFAGVSCEGACEDVVSGTPIVVSTGGTAPNRNFVLQPGGRISGIVRAAATSAPLANVTVRVTDGSGAAVGFGLTDGAGAYVTNGLPAGVYYAYTESFSGFLDEIFDNVSCPLNDCLGHGPVTHGAAIPVVVGATSAGRDFALDRGGRITGRVTNASTGAAAQGVTVQAVAVSGASGSAIANSLGDYTIQGLVPGDYAVLTGGAGPRGLINEIYNDIPCLLTCSTATALLAAPKVTVALEQIASGINFALAPGGSLSGVVTNAASGAPIPNVRVRILTRAANTISTAPAVTTNASGAYTANGLPPGSYYGYTENESGFINETHGGLACAGLCEGTEPTVSAPIEVAAGAAVTGIGFALDPGARIRGRITDAATGGPLEFVQVRVVEASGRLATLAESDSNGNYVSRAGLPAGTYYASTDSHPGFVKEVFANVPCTGCADIDAVATGTPIVVAAGATVIGRDFALDAGGRIQGTVTDAATGVIVPFVNLQVFDAAGRFATLGSSGAANWISDQGLPTGTYYAFSSAFSHVNEVYENVPCPQGCVGSMAAGGTPIAVTAGAIATGRNLALALRTGVPGPPRDIAIAATTIGLIIDWTAPIAGGQAASYVLEAGLTPGTTAVSFSVTDSRFLAAGVPQGLYFLRVRGINAAGTGPASAEFPLLVGPAGPLPGAPTALRLSVIGTRLMLTWNDAVSGGAPANYLVEAGTATGIANIATLPAGSRAFTYDPVPGGFYFLRVRGQNGTGIGAPSNEVMLVMGGVPAPPAAPRRVGAVVAGSTVTLNWSAPAGPVTGYVIEAGSATGLSNLAVLPIGAVTTISFPGIPPGIYYVRIRALNAQGRSVVSDEAVIVVG